MIAEGQVVLFRFPQTNLEEGKLRPALVIKKVPGEYDDWLICMISSRLHQKHIELDEIPGNTYTPCEGYAKVLQVKLFRQSHLTGSATLRLSQFIRQPFPQ